MPIPHDADWLPSTAFNADEDPVFDVESRAPQWPEEGIRTEDCDGPVSDLPVQDSIDGRRNHGSNADPEEAICTDRKELIERIKRGESPTWVPSNALKQEYLRTNNGESPSTPRKPRPARQISSLLPPAELRNPNQDQPPLLEEGPIESPEIERPHSALHAGDFTLDHISEKESASASLYNSEYPSDTLHDGPLGTSPSTPWYTPSASLADWSLSDQSSPSDTIHEDLSRRTWRSRAPSLNSYQSSSYVLKAPTTPLVQQSNNTDLDFSPRDQSKSPEKSSRRRTLPPQAFHTSYIGSHGSASFQPTRSSLSYGREGPIRQSHQSRRSLSSNWSLQASTSPQTPPLRSRRTSSNSEASPLQHASMVGSYEESILRGWMSTAPSKPLDFTANIGVLGRGNCKPKCPPHVTVNFPAVYYDWGSGSGSSSVDNEPSPYVGHIDLQQSSAAGEPKATLKDEAVQIAESTPENRNLHNPVSPAGLGTRKAKKRRLTSPSSAPPGGSYRIPQQGQLQIIIKNPNKTAVKLFLVPYDLEGMEPGTKTFIRQRSYSADNVVDKPQIKNASSSTTTSKKQTLRYLIHLNICSPSKGRFYLYHQIRVVFANRVPDNKEKLNNEIQVPQPRYSVYKPNKDAVSIPGSGAVANMAAVNPYRRQSSGFGLGSYQFDGHATQIMTGGSTYPSIGGAMTPVPSTPLTITTSKQEPADLDRVSDVDSMELDTPRPTTSDDPRSPLSDKSNRIFGTQLSSSHKSSSSQGSDGYTKLNKGDCGYGGIYGRPRTPEPGEGLLARRLKGLGMQTYTEDSGI